MSTAKQKRFERAEGGGGHRVGDRNESRSTFLGRMWSLFGPPDWVSDGNFSYSIRDRDTGLMFEVYSGPTGPAYGGAPGEETRLSPVLKVFDELLDDTPLADCELEIPIGEGKDVIGVKHGKPFENSIRPPAPTPAAAVSTAKQALATEKTNPMFYYLAMLKLSETAPGQRKLLGQLWTRVLTAAMAEIDREFARPTGPDRSNLGSAVDLTLPALEQTALLAGMDYKKAIAPFRAKIVAARKAIRDSDRES